MNPETKYLVHVEDKRALMRVVGHASYLNCVGVGDFFTKLAADGIEDVVVDLSQCTGMDSTFLGTLAGGALRLRKIGAKMSLVNLNERNMELAQNLGLENIMSIFPNCDTQTNVEENAPCEITAGKVDAHKILKAHETLVEIKPENGAKFEDVITFLKRETQG